MAVDKVLCANVYILSYEAWHRVINPRSCFNTLYYTVVALITIIPSSIAFNNPLLDIGFSLEIRFDLQILSTDSRLNESIKAKYFF